MVGAAVCRSLCLSPHDSNPRVYGSGLTGLVASTERAISGSVSVVAEQTSGTVR